MFMNALCIYMYADRLLISYECLFHASKNRRACLQSGLININNVIQVIMKAILDKILVLRPHSVIMKIYIFLCSSD